MARREHWESVYETKRPDQVSWFQPHATLSSEIIRGTVEDRSARILDVGGGASTLVDDLLGDGYERVTVMDLSAAALDHSRRRLGRRATLASWVVGDVLAVPFADDSAALWHDRAVFHFLTDPADRARYVAEARRVVVPGGLVLLATFASDGPERCSGLPVLRYGAGDLQRELGNDFVQLDSCRDVHRTPAGGTQAFTFGLFRLGGSG